MEKLLLRLAEQLDAVDEASLMGLWDKYAKATCEFEPTRRWELSALVLCLIEAKHMKNQLFNHYWARAQQPAGAGKGGNAPAAEPVRDMPPRPEHRCRILSFPGEDEKGE